MPRFVVLAFVMQIVRLHIGSNLVVDQVEPVFHLFILDVSIIVLIELSNKSFYLIVVQVSGLCSVAHFDICL